MKKVILAVVGVVVLIVGGVFIYLSTMDWNSHKNKIAGQFSEITGKDVVFDGPVDFKVFPSPYLSASNVKIFDKNRSANPNALAVIKNMQVEFSLGSLFGGKFDVSRMAIIEPEMVIEVLPEGKINWQSPINYDQEYQKIDVVLDRVNIEKARVKIISQNDDVNIILDNLNAEVVGDSIFGPYRIEGTYMKNNNPEGFALQLGRFSDSISTPLNFVVNHPRSKTHLRFDGSFLLRNNSLTGDVIFESENFVDFVNSYFQYEFENDFNYPVAVSLGVNTNKNKIDISNFVLKYGDTAGAGNVLIPLKDKEFNYDDSEKNERLKVEVGFNMTSLNLEPVVKMVEKMAKVYDDDKKSFYLDLGYDVLFDLKADKTIYKDQNIRDFVVSLDVLKDNIAINTIGGVAPGETKFTYKGKIFSLENTLTYNTDLSVNSVDILKVSQWLNHKIPTVNDFSWKNFELVANISGNMKNIKISPINAKLDKTKVEGEIGLVRGARPSMLLDLSLNSINFDNYINKMPDDLLKKSIKDKFIYWFDKASFLKDVDIQSDIKLGLGIYHSTPFEGIRLTYDLKDGVMNINELIISSLRNASFDFKGELKGFGEVPSVNNLKYDINTQNFYSIFPEDILPEFIKNAKDFKKVSIKGVSTGDFDLIATKTVFRVDNLDLIYSGNVKNVEGKENFDGKVDLRAPDFIKFVNRFNVDYNPKVMSMGVFRLRSSVKGTYDNFNLSDMEIYIGANKFDGSLSFKAGVKPEIVAKLHVNRFEFDRFFYNLNASNSTQPAFVSQGSDSNVDFIARPVFDKTKIDYVPYLKANLKADVVADIVSYKDEILENAKFKVNIDDVQIAVSDILCEYQDSKVSGNIAISMDASNSTRGSISIEGLPLKNRFLGNKYGFKEGTLDIKSDFSTSATSEDSFFKDAAGNIGFSFSNPAFVGWDIDAIEEDLMKRTLSSEGLLQLVQDKLQSGKTEFIKFEGNLSLSKGNYEVSSANFVSNKYNVGMTAKGSIELWDIKGDFDLALLNVKDLANVKFSYNGPIAFPKVSANIEDIETIFRNRQNELNEKNRKAEEEKMDKLTFLMGEEEDRATVSKKVLDDKIAFIEGRLKSVKNRIIYEEYNTILNILKSISSEVDGVVLITKSDESTFTNDLIEKAKTINNLAEKAVVDNQSRLDNVYLQDIKDKVNREYTSLAEMHNNTKANIVRYRDKFVTYPNRMAVAGKVNVINNDENVKKSKDDIEKSFLRLDEISGDGARDYVAIQVENRVEEFDKYSAKVENMIDRYKEEESVLNRYIDGLLSYLEEIAVAAEKEYDEKVAEELLKQKIEENTGKISSSTGKNVTVVRDLEEIMKSEEIIKSEEPVVLENVTEEPIKKEEVRVLDFSKGSKTSSSSKKTKTVITREEITTRVISKSDEGSVLKKVDGEISGASGSIIKK